MDDKRFAEMISKIAHELRSPLTSVKGFSATLLSRWDRFTDEQKRQFVETIHFDAERMGRIVSEVLDLARIEAGRLELNRTRVDLAEAVEVVRARFEELPGSERVQVTIVGETFVWADADRLGHIVGNLLENALKFSDEGPIVISSDRDGDRVNLTVLDHGVGIAPDRVGDVFSGPAPHGQASGPSGTGLGLYLTRGLVEAHGGVISVESKFGELTVFTVALPTPEAAL